MIRLIQLLVIVSSHFIIRVAPAGSNKGILVDWTLRLLLEGSRPELAELLGTQRTATIMRELPAQEFTSLSLILPEDCSHPQCLQALNNCSLSPGRGEVRRAVVRRTEDGVWLVDCALFGQEDIPVQDGGLPGRRLAGPGRDRGQTGEQEEEEEEAGPGKPGVAVRTPVVQSYSNTSQAGQAVEAEDSENCHQLHAENITKFYQDCCLHHQARDTRCALKLLINSYEEQHRQVISSTVRPIQMTDPFATSAEESEGDISRLGKALDLEMEVAEERNRTSEDLKIQETIEDLKSQEIENVSFWKNKYFTVLGFFLVFLAIFLFTIIFLIYKIRKCKNENYLPPTSPGPHLQVERRTREGYSSVMEEEEVEDGLPLTPATQQAQSFQY